MPFELVALRKFLSFSEHVFPSVKWMSFTPTFQGSYDDCVGVYVFQHTGGAPQFGVPFFLTPGYVTFVFVLISFKM